jgi:hypothetical protein
MPGDDLNLNSLSKYSKKPNRYVLEAQSHCEGFRNRFAPAWEGLLLAAEGKPLETETAIALGTRRFCGWSKTTHWLLAHASNL